MLILLLPSGVAAASGGGGSVVQPPTDSISSLCFSPKGNYLVATSWDNQVRCWEIQISGTVAKAAIADDQLVLCLAWKDDGMTVFSGGCDKQEAGIRLSSTRTLGSKRKSIHNSSQNAVTHSVKYPLMVVGASDRNLIVFNLNKPRVKYCEIMGREENEDLSPGQLMYPCMQCADILLLEADIFQLGMDQRKVSMLSRDYRKKIKKTKNKPIMLSQRTNSPIILPHHMLPGLKEGQEKLSKSDAPSTIFMEDEEDQVEKEIHKAHCLEGTVEGNPCLEYIKYIIFPWFQEFEEGFEEHGGNKTFKNLEDLITDYQNKKMHPADLKPALAKALNRILKPVRDHFNNDPEAKALLEKVKKYNVTR
ncbi:hypothetical protein MKW98_018677 [Papaver atlanticum]|uniref:tyrosine--tRNA ligase n=1 Tax=Papaver atlanticum TaxID=357466 RepID=A0AAD4T2W8_9MAGN|nr:hypothetical protein MKW98_018677 [Papaver atlanticum]